MQCRARCFRAAATASTLAGMEPTPRSLPPRPPLAPFVIEGVDHVGIRVSSRDVALSFYEGLGFRLAEDLPEHQAAELCNAQGVRINLIFNAQASAINVLQDVERKWPGLTHVAFVVDDLDRLCRTLSARGRHPTEGPLRIGRRRVAVFFRDPDGNVLEFNQLTDDPCGDPSFPPSEEIHHAPPP